MVTCVVCSHPHTHSYGSQVQEAFKKNGICQSLRCKLEGITYKTRRENISACLILIMFE